MTDNKTEKPVSYNEQLKLLWLGMQDTLKRPLTVESGARLRQAYQAASAAGGETIEEALKAENAKTVEILEKQLKRVGKAAKALRVEGAKLTADIEAIAAVCETAEGEPKDFAKAAQVYLAGRTGMSTHRYLAQHVLKAVEKLANGSPESSGADGSECGSDSEAELDPINFTVRIKRSAEEAPPAPPAKVQKL